MSKPELSVIIPTYKESKNIELMVIRVFDSLKNIPIRMISYGGSENNISILVDGSKKKETLQALNEGLFNLSTARTQGTQS